MSIHLHAKCANLIEVVVILLVILLMAALPVMNHTSLDVFHSAPIWRYTYVHVFGCMENLERQTAGTPGIRAGELHT